MEGFGVGVAEDVAGSNGVAADDELAGIVAGAGSGVSGRGRSKESSIPLKNYVQKDVEDGLEKLSVDRRP